MIQLYGFQQAAADQMATRVVDYIDDPAFTGRGAAKKAIPFVQFLSSITASGKTVVLADTVAQIAALTSVKPVVLWMSKLTVVVEQTLSNLEPGGTYNDLIGQFEVRALNELSMDALRTTDAPFLYFATTGTFNVKTMAGRKVFDAQIDKTDQSIWDALLIRPDLNNQRRPLVVVYDEAHNLSDQQTSLLLGLEPQAFLLSTATSRVPQSFQAAVTDRLKAVADYDDGSLNTPILASEVAASGLVKQRVDLIGRQSQMEDVVTEMIDELNAAQVDAAAAGFGADLKAVYVCRTNITEGDDKRRDDPKRPFNQRQAPPILIWRHLVHGLGIDPAKVAAYCDLKVDKDYPTPPEFVHFRGGEKDYAALVSGGYTHIIFNQSLQEGWDDPLVYFAYIDKTLGSTIAAEQIVGRLLRQPGREHYQADRLNAAQLFIRVESNKVFDDVVDQTQARLQGDNVPVTVTKTGPGTSNRTSIDPIKSVSVPDVATHTEDAIEVMEGVLTNVPDYRTSAVETTGIGRRTKVQKLVGSKDQALFKWEEVGTSSRVAARWMFNRALRRFHRDAAAIITLDQPKWDAPIGVGSPAADSLVQYAEQVGKAFTAHSYIEIADDDDEDFVVGPALVRAQSLITYKNAVHTGYSDLNASLEVPFAAELDDTGFTWARNPSRSGYGIPLINPGGNDTFYPDFLVWVHGDVYAIDTKGSHIKADAMQKLVRIRQAPGRPRLHVRFIVQGRLDGSGNQLDSDGYTVIGFRPDGNVFFTQAVTLKLSTEIATKKSK